MRVVERTQPQKKDISTPPNWWYYWRERAVRKPYRAYPAYAYKRTAMAEVSWTGRPPRHIRRRKMFLPPIPGDERIHTEVLSLSQGMNTALSHVKKALEIAEAQKDIFSKEEIEMLKTLEGNLIHGSKVFRREASPVPVKELKVEERTVRGIF